MIQIERLGVVLAPRDERHAKFNAGMVRQGDRVHMLYRWAQTNPPGVDGKVQYVQDYIAYARLDPEGRLLEDADRPFIAPFSPDNTAGCQDPRIVEFEGAYYIFFCSWNLDICRVSIARTKDFSELEHLGTIPTTVWDKDAFILPERVHGKIVYIHRIEPEIQIDYFNTFEEMFEPAYWKDYGSRAGERMAMKGEYPWENLKVGGSIPPIRTPYGWLLIYHGVADDRVPFCYRAGAALLDAENPSRVVARLPYPLIEPTAEYELHGDVDNVVFPQGAYMHEGWLYLCGPVGRIRPDGRYGSGRGAGDGGSSCRRPRWNRPCIRAGI